MKVLLIEDSQTLQFQMTKFIEEFGHQVIVANSGETAIQLIEQAGADLIICDIEMPGLSGFETVPIIREFLGERWVPIIMMTGRESVEDCVKGLSVGADDYLVKPVTKELLHAKIKVMERFMVMQTQIDQLKNQPKEPSQFDSLTHVYSHHYFNELAEMQWAILSRQRLSATLLIIDIDYFSAYSDYYGREEAEECLKQVANVLHSETHRPGDFVGRLDRDDFIVMLPDTDNQGAKQVVSKIMKQIEGLNIEHKRSKVMGTVSVSVGGATCQNTSNCRFEKTLNLAFDSLHDAKLKQSERVVISEQSGLIADRTISNDSVEASPH